MSCPERARCLYCDMPLYSSHEHDHFPVPKRLGGTETHCVCRNCHTLKDRNKLRDWHPAESMQALSGLWTKANPVERILLAKMLCITADAAALPPPAPVEAPRGV